MRMRIWQGKPKCSEETCPSATLSFAPLFSCDILEVKIEIEILNLCWRYNGLHSYVCVIFSHIMELTITSKSFQAVHSNSCLMVCCFECVLVNCYVLEVVMCWLTNHFVS
jgi:hypothetical protein